MKPTFLNRDLPFIMSMILKDNPDDVRYAIRNSAYDGADAFGIQLCYMKHEYKTEENYKQMFAQACGKPIYITNYRAMQNEGLTDEECAEGLILGLKSGATLADVMGDMFDKGAEMELTKNQTAIDKQMKLIDKIHSLGKEVLISSHICKFTPAEQVLEIAYEQQRRGADVVKIVTAANSDEEQIENLRITALLKKELKVPFLYLSGGTHSKIHRMIGPLLGCVSYLAVLKHDARAIPTQPTVRAAKAVRDNLDYMPEIVY
ncbi:MAG: type I 3-dehydroquinate dehydratase [Clostridia bacterium]|nr:type I 3-dehydroquinate dehydratase [Clostridia bacterium]